MDILIVVSLFFTAVLVGLVAIYVGYITVKASPAYELKRRLRKLAVNADERLPSALTIDILHEMSPVDKFFYRFSLLRSLDKLIDNAGLKIDVKLFALYILIAASVGFTLGALIGRGIIFSVILLIIGGAAPLIYLQVQKNKRLAKFTEEFPGTLDMISRSLKAGHSISAAVQMVGTEMPEPIGGLFRTAYDEQTLGLSIKDALSRLSERIPSIDLHLFLAAVDIHREVGGDLTETLERLANTIRERIKIRRQVKVYTAQGRLTGYILAALPIFMALFLYATSPDYIGELVVEKEGKYAIGFVVAGQIIGFLVIQKLIRIKI